jgi:DNA-binding MarR family transcriptional regulator
MTDRSDFMECLDCRCAAARREAHRLTRRYDERLRPYELSIGQFTMLTTLVIGGPARMKALADRLGLERTTLTRNVELAEHRGLVAVQPGEDGRERVVALTELGRRKADGALPAWRAAQAEATRAD